MDSGENITGPFNFGNPNEISIGQLAKIILKLTDSKSKIIYQKLPEDDPKRRKPDINKAINILDWNPYFDLNEGLIKTIQYFKKIKK